MTLISIGPPITLLQNVVYALPAKAVLITSSLALEVSLDGTAWVALANATTTGAVTGYVFVRCTAGNALITAKASSNLVTDSLAVGALIADSLTLDRANPDVTLSRGAANTLLLSDGDTLAFGGVTSAFPAIDRNGAALRVILADGSALGSFQAATISGTFLSASIAFQSTSLTFATLPAGSEGLRSFITDSSTAVPGAIAAGGGANNVPVYHNGTNWIVG